MEDLTGQQSLEELERLTDIIAIGDKVKQTLETPGWKDVIGPLLDKMIIDVMGGKQNGLWHNGSLDNKDLDEGSLKCLAAYKRALVDFHSHIYQNIIPLESYKERYKELIQQEKNPVYTEVDTDYGKGEEVKFQEEY